MVAAAAVARCLCESNFECVGSEAGEVENGEEKERRPSRDTHKRSLGVCRVYAACRARGCTLETS